MKVLDEKGRGNAAHVLAGIQWIINNKEKYNIRIANLSVGTSDSGVKDPMIKAVNAAWDQGIVIVAAAGNNGPDVGTITSPGISKKIITVGASDDNKSVKIWGETLINFSGRGPTKECVIKPDVIAPGTDIISCLTPTPNIDLSNTENVKIISENYLQMSGTSMSTPMVSGAIAILIQKYPWIKPDGIKYMLRDCTNILDGSKNQQGWGLIDIEKMLLKEAKNVR